jgi:AcrR family transcriptional regulator
MSAGSIPGRGPELFAHPLSRMTMEVLRERGFEAAEVADICRRAGVDPDDLPRRMRDKSLLALAVSEAYAEDFQREVGGAFDAEPVWPDSLRAAAYQVVRWITRHPEATWWGSVGLLEAGETARARRDEIFAWAAGMIDAGRAAAPDPATVPEGAATLAIGAIVETLGRSMQGGISGDPVEGVRWLMYGAVRPYLGEEAARAELELPPPPDLDRRRDAEIPPDPDF